MTRFNFPRLNSGLIEYVLMIGITYYLTLDKLLNFWLYILTGKMAIIIPAFLNKIICKYDT